MENDQTPAQYTPQPGDTHDFRDYGDPMVKLYPLYDWRSWERRPDGTEGK